MGWNVLIFLWDVTHQTSDRGQSSGLPYPANTTHGNLCRGIGLENRDSDPRPLSCLYVMRACPKWLATRQKRKAACLPVSQQDAGMTRENHTKMFQKVKKFSENQIINSELLVKNNVILMHSVVSTKRSHNDTVLNQTVSHPQTLLLSPS